MGVYVERWSPGSTGEETCTSGLFAVSKLRAGPLADFALGTSPAFSRAIGRSVGFHSPLHCRFVPAARLLYCEYLHAASAQTTARITQQLEPRTPRPSRPTPRHARGWLRRRMLTTLRLSRHWANRCCLALTAACPLRIQTGAPLDASCRTDVVKASVPGGYTSPTRRQIPLEEHQTWVPWPISHISGGSRERQDLI